MKGVVFNLLEEMVEKNFGDEVWEGILDEAGQDGIYISSQTYPNKMLFDLVAVAHEKSGIPVNDLVCAFGEFVFPSFYRDNQSFFTPA